MIRKYTMKLGRTLRRVLIACVILSALCLIVGFFYSDLDDRNVFVGIGGCGLAVSAVIWIGFKLGNRSKYKKLCNKVGEIGIQKLEEEYQRGKRTKEAVFGDIHLFVEPGCNTLGFDMIEYSQILWMYLNKHTTKYEFIPVLCSWSIRIYLDDPERGFQQMIEVNAKRFRKDPMQFFNQVLDRNPRILLGYNPEWDRMHNNDKESFIRFVRRQGE